MSDKTASAEYIEDYPSISLKTALRHLRNHGCEEPYDYEFFEELGEHETYDTQKVFNWLGY